MYKRCARYCVPSNEALNSRWQSYVKSGNKFLICWAGEGTGHLQPGFEQFEISTPLGTIVLWARWDKICQVLLLPGSVKTEWDWGFLPWPFPPSWQGLPESHSAYQFLSKRNLLNYSSKANSTWQTETQPAVSSTLPTGSSDSAYREQWQCCLCRRLLTGSKDAHKLPCTNHTLLFCATCTTPRGKTCPWGPCEKSCTQPHNHSLPSSPGLSSYRLSNICSAMSSKGWCGSTAAFQMLSTLAKKLWTDPLAPSSHWSLFPDTCTAVLPLCRSTELPGTACSTSKVTDTCQVGHSPNEGKQGIHHTKCLGSLRLLGIFRESQAKQEKIGFFQVCLGSSEIISSLSSPGQSEQETAVPTMFPNKWCVILLYVFTWHQKNQLH